MFTIDELITTIGFSDEEKQEIISFSDDDSKKDKITYIFECIKAKDFKSINEKISQDADYARASLLCMLKIAVVKWDSYIEKGIPYSIYVDTMGDIKVWAYNYRRQTGVLGLAEVEWIYGSVNLFRFKLGRLQFNFEEFRENEHYTVDVGLKNGDKVLDVHIQQDGPFTDELCGESFKMAEEFYEKYFSDFDYKAFTCHSWLLSPGLAQVLPETSNIIKFGKRFTILEYDPENDDQAVERIFETRFKGENFKPTSLQEKARKLLDEGGHLGIAMGVILK